MKKGPKVQNWEVLDDVRLEGNCLRNYDGIGLHRGWEDAIINSIDRRIEDRRRMLEARGAKLAEAPAAKKRTA